jgi:hypothetical protein
MIRKFIQIVENAHATGKIVEGKQLIHKYGGTIMPFVNLPNTSKKALRQWMVIEGDYPEYKEDQYGLAEIPVADLMKIIYDQNGEGMTYEEFWGNTDEHSGARVSSIWPILWGSDGWQDGMHRLARYIQAGMTMIPVVAIL